MGLRSQPATVRRKKNREQNGIRDQQNEQTKSNNDAPRVFKRSCSFSGPTMRDDGTEALSIMDLPGPQLHRKSCTCNYLHVGGG